MRVGFGHRIHTVIMHARLLRRTARLSLMGCLLLLSTSDSLSLQTPIGQCDGQSGVGQPLGQGAATYDP